ncbi:MAG: glutathionylspermidine synthase family protein [Bacteroidota bacterium]
MDNRLTKLAPPDAQILKKNGLKWFATGENSDYLSTDFVRVTPPELERFQEAATELYKRIVETAYYVAEAGLWKEMGIPHQAVDLIQHSLRKEEGAYLIGRFDFSGGLEGLPIHLLEFNADTCSLIPETAKFQQLYWSQERKDLMEPPFNNLVASLKNRFETILADFPGKTPYMLISSLGHEEDWLNTDVIAEAARKADFKEVQNLALSKVIFAEDEGIYMQLGPEDYRRYDFWFKFIPWEFILFEEPELFQILERIILDDLCMVLNPASSILYQSKGLMTYLYERYPDQDYLLKTAFSKAAFPNNKYVRKPSFGRMGENIAYHDGGSEPAYETEGDYGDFKPVFQELADFNEDWQDHRYQPSVFWTGEPSALCFRRQDDLIIDDDAEFVGHHIAF